MLNIGDCLVDALHHIRLGLHRWNLQQMLNAILLFIFSYNMGITVQDPRAKHLEQMNTRVFFDAQHISNLLLPSAFLVSNDLQSQIGHAKY